MKHLAAREGVSTTTLVHTVLTDLTGQPVWQTIGPACAWWQPLPGYCKECGWFGKEGFKVGGTASPTSKGLKKINRSPQQTDGVSAPIANTARHPNFMRPIICECLCVKGVRWEWEWLLCTSLYTTTCASLLF